MERKTFGGFLQLDSLRGEEWYSQLYRFNLGRTALSFLVREKGYKTIYAPYYLCDTLDKRLEHLGVTIVRYHLSNELLPEDGVLSERLSKEEAVLVVNYFGILCESDILRLKKRYKNIIIDNTQAFFSKPVEGIDTIYTCRKWFGVTDGAYLYTDLSKDAYDFLPVDSSAERMTHIFKKFENENGDYYEAYHSIEESYESEDIKKMSPLTQNLLKAIDYEEIANRRRQNYMTLQEKLGKVNHLPWKQNEEAIPFMYPLYCEKTENMRASLREKRCFLPLLWPNVLSLEPCFERGLAENLLLIPCDQRYSQEDMTRLADMVLECGKRSLLGEFEGGKIGFGS